MNCDFETSVQDCLLVCDLVFLILNPRPNSGSPYIYMYDYVVMCGSFEPFTHEIKRPKMNTSVVFALVILAIKLMTRLNVFKCEGDEGNIACQVDDVVERVQGRGG